MPNYAQVMNFINNVKSSQKITLNGINGLKVTASNGNSIFIPAGGYIDGSEKKKFGEDLYLWSSFQGNQNVVYTFISNGSTLCISGNAPCSGLNVRPVSVKP